MPFGLKNVGANHQWLVNKVFKPLIAKTMEVYVWQRLAGDIQDSLKVQHEV